MPRSLPQASVTRSTAFSLLIGQRKAAAAAAHAGEIPSKGAIPPAFRVNPPD
jgi:hypothetical protein